MRNVIQMALKRPFFFKKITKIRLPLLIAPACDTLELQQFALHAAQLRAFQTKKILVQAPLRSKTLVVPLLYNLSHGTGHGLRYNTAQCTVL